MMNYLRILIALLCSGAPVLANFSMSPSGSTTLFAVDAANQGTALCAAASTECAASVPINTAGAPIFTATIPGAVTPYIAGAVNSATNGLFTNILQGNAVVSTTNGLYVNLLQGNSLITSANPIFAQLTTGAAAIGSVTANAGTNLNTSALATSANLTAGTMKTQVVDGSGNVIASTSNSLNVQCANCSGSGVSTTDEATFTAGMSVFAGGGGFFQTTATNNALTTGQQGMFQVTANRALFSNLRNAAGAEVGVAAAPLQVSLANTAANAAGSIKSELVDGSGNITTVSAGGSAHVLDDNSAATLAAIQGPIPACSATPCTTVIGLTVPALQTSGGYTTAFFQPVASDNHTNLKNGAGQVYWVLAENNSATVNYLRFYNAATGFNGCNSATNLVTQIQIPANTAVGGVNIALTYGVPFSTGISYCVTSGYATNDTTNATATAMSITIGYN